jgi:hypothetical protein
MGNYFKPISYKYCFFSAMNGWAEVDRKMDLLTDKKYSNVMLNL